MLDSFDSIHQDKLRRIWILGDVHGGFDHIGEVLRRTPQDQMPRWLIFLGDLELEAISFRQALEPIRRQWPNLQILFIHGNHDADSHGHWRRLHDCGDAIALHGQVVDLDGTKIAGLGGNFLRRVWAPPNEPVYAKREAATFRHPNLVARGQLHAPRLHGAIYQDELEKLRTQRADLLVTHEAFSCHPYGWQELDRLARGLGVFRAFHGHTHDDLAHDYKAHQDRLGFEVVGVDFRCVKNGLGEKVFDHDRLEAAT